jgi:hypothetical protein
MKQKHKANNKKTALSEIKKCVGKGKYQDKKKPVIKKE